MIIPSSLWPSLLMTTLLLFVACEETGGGAPVPDPEIPAPLLTLNYDRSVFDAPVLQNGSFQAAVRFREADLVSLQGQKLVDIHYYIAELPASTVIKVYSGSFAGGPDSLIYSQVVTNEVQADAWNRHSLVNPIILSGADLWLGIQIAYPKDSRSVGCDPGPAVPDGDWLFDDFDGQWLPLSQRSNGQVNINWNIRGAVDPN